MTTEQREITVTLYNCTMLPGSWDKRFIRNVVDRPELTETQNEWIFRLLYKYRKQCGKVYEKYKSNPNCCKK